MSKTVLIKRQSIKNAGTINSPQASLITYLLINLKSISLLYFGKLKSKFPMFYRVGHRTEILYFKDISDSFSLCLCVVHIQWNPDFSNPRFPEPPDSSNQTLFPLDLLHSSSTISPLISRTLDSSKIPITRTSFGSRGTN